MRKFFLRAKSLGCILLVLCCAAFVYALTRLPVFEKGSGYEFSCGASSSAVTVRPASPFLYKLTHAAAGESVRYEGDRFEEIKARYRAEVLFEEETDGVKNYYMYSPQLGGGIELNGYRVNLHIAVSKEQTAVGTPVIFGGF